MDINIIWNPHHCNLYFKGGDMLCPLYCTVFGPVYIDGVPVKISDSFRPPPKVCLFTFFF